ncbi:tyrosine-protein phosphatase [Streptomyces yanii]|uniref:Tyrosine-protein phosphatase n=1 Tax=Streptomyces yanii TaxID=78510 RepID=A0ABV5R1S7_9ACTN
MSLINFRDPILGADPEGMRIRPGLLYRSAQPSPHADHATLTQLDDHGIRTVVDLRGIAECEPADWAAAEAAGITVIAARMAPTTDTIAAALQTMTTAADLGSFYLLLAEQSPAAVTAAVEAAARPGGVLLHCAAGKDRTGLVTALLLDLLGVPAEAIAADYARTGEALPQIRANLAERHPAALNDPATRDAVPAPLLAAPAEAMTVFLDLMRTRHGGAAAFLTACGTTADTLAAFRSKTSKEALAC